MTISLDFAQSAYVATAKNATRDLMRFLSQSLCDLLRRSSAHGMGSTKHFMGPLTPLAVSG